MTNHARKRGSTYVYVKHEVDTPDVVDDTILLHATREKDVNISSGEPNCNERNGRAGKTFTKLVGNMEPDFSGSNDACGESGESSESSGASDTDSSLGNEGALGVEYEDEEVSDPSGEGTDYVDSSDLKSCGSDSDGEVVFRRSRHASYKFVGEYFLRKIRVIPKLKLTEMQKVAKEALKVDLRRGKYKKARKWALEEINRRVSYMFNKLWDYANALKKTDPDNNIKGLMKDISELLPKVKHRVCARHLYAN
ncbi:hypothetical protein PVK06_007498 [Gossypium arboreum]|uniref:Uncharacterized protein n=1 Tax=Gossypium arboreum TaxID=29729 RepID=A0ABR0QIA0_GOSAR|nr:hypothetical protein PVK06_007498 [Gossypium arboreum]